MPLTTPSEQSLPTRASLETAVPFALGALAPIENKAAQLYSSLGTIQKLSCTATDVQLTFFWQKGAFLCMGLRG